MLETTILFYHAQILGSTCIKLFHLKFILHSIYSNIVVWNVFIMAHTFYKFSTMEMVDLSKSFFMRKIDEKCVICNKIKGYEC